MATNYPTSADSFTDPTSGQNLNSPSHSAQHANANDAIAAIEAFVGTSGAPGAAISGLLAKTGGTMSGAIAMGANKITGLANGSASTDAANVGQTVPTGTYQKITATQVNVSTTAAAQSSPTLVLTSTSGLSVGMMVRMVVGTVNAQTQHFGYISAISSPNVTVTNTAPQAWLPTGDMVGTGAAFAANTFYSFLAQPASQILPAGYYRMTLAGGGGAGGGGPTAASTHHPGGGGAGGVASLVFRSDGATASTFILGLGGAGQNAQCGGFGGNTSVGGGGFTNPAGTDAANGGGPGDQATTTTDGGAGVTAFQVTYNDTTVNGVMWPGTGGSYLTSASVPIFKGWAAVCSPWGPGGAGAGGASVSTAGGNGAPAGTLFGGGSPGTDGGQGTAQGTNGGDATDGSASGGGGAGTNGTGGGSKTRGGHGGSGFIELVQIA